MYFLSGSQAKTALDMSKLYVSLFLLVCIVVVPASAQFTIDGQIVQRSEYRHGFNRLILEEEDPSSFIAHRVRLRAQYTLDKFSFYAAIQDIRTWGNTSQAKATDPLLSLHQGWAQYNFHPNWSVRLGRQELNYDNARLLGNLDWALQARAHDFALVKYDKDNVKIHAGFGYNQDEPSRTGNIFSTPNQYKTAQLLWLEKSWEKVTVAFMGWNDGRQFVTRDTAGALVDQGQFFRTTLGLSTLKYNVGQTSLSGFYYYQFGEDAAGRDLNAFDISAQVKQTLFEDEEKGSNLQAVAGFEILSGTDMTASSSDSESFTPLYGTNHAHNGYMDYFYVGGQWSNSVGLQDYFLKVRSQFKPGFFTQIDGHVFLAEATPARVLPGSSPEELDKYLGTEIDFSLGFLFHPAVSLQFGYSHLIPSTTFEFLDDAENARDTQNWAYLMLVFRPTMKNKNIGILF